MRRIATTLAVIGLSLAASAAANAPTRQVRVQNIVAGSSVPADLLKPEGKSRWYLDGVQASGAALRSIFVDGAKVVIEDPAKTVYADPTGGDAAVRWVLPDRGGVDLRMGTRSLLEIDERRLERTSRLRIESEIVGIGWIHLPSGPREVVLQRSFVSRSLDGGTLFSPDATFHRWIDPRAGVVAQTSRAAGASPSGTAPSITAGEVVQEVVTGAADLKIYVDQLYLPNYTQLKYGWDRGAGTPISSLVPNPGIVTAGDLIALNSWDFSGNTTGVEIAQTDTPVNAQETCNYKDAPGTPSCGFGVPGAQLGRQDRNFPNPSSMRKDNQVTVRENRPTDVTIWVRAGALNEGKTGIFGTGESRFCYLTEGSTVRNPVPLWRFPHQDAGGWYMAAGDHFEGGPVDSCQQTLFNQTCGSGGFIPILYAKSCAASGNDPAHTGKQYGDVLKGGVVTIPSGHTLNALLVRTVGDFCVYTGSSCSALSRTDAARTTVYIWQTPNLGSVAFIQSVQNPTDLTSWTTVEETNMKFGLFPPLSITATGTTTSSVSLSWNPGNDTHRINGYKIYWDTDSGSGSSYAFNSDTHSGQVSFSGTTATISGLLSGTTYYFTVTSKGNYTDPSSSITTTYESILYPTQVSGDPSFVYPVEVQATTTSPTCIPTVEVTNLTLGKAGGQIQFCWDPVTDVCLQGYDVIGSDTLSPAGFSTVGQVGAGSTCWTGNPSQSFYLVISRGTGGTGPWGHFGR